MIKCFRVNEAVDIIAHNIQAIVLGHFILVQDVLSGFVAHGD
ncbi:MAG: hypothetical protein ACHQF0_10575 [Chitinophagales bacterium]